MTEPFSFADAATERAFLDDILKLLRAGEPEVALAKIRDAVRRLENTGHDLVSLIIQTVPEGVTITGWNQIEKRIAKLEADADADVIITAISIDISWIGHVGTPKMLQPDASGRLTPYIETNYFADTGHMHFSTANRQRLLAGYSAFGSVWQGDFVDLEIDIGTSGLERLFGSLELAQYEKNADASVGTIYALAGCAVATLLHIAVKRKIQSSGLPRPLAVMVGSNEQFPHFDAPVVSVDEARNLMAVVTPRLVPSQPKATPPDTMEEPTHPHAASGKQLRQRLSQPTAEIPNFGGRGALRSLIDRLLGR